MATLWLEVDDEGTILRRATEVEDLFADMDPPVRDLARLLDTRVEVRASVLRRAGSFRFGIGRGHQRVTLDAEVSEGVHGARLVLHRVEPFGGQVELGGLLVGHAERHASATVVTDPDDVILYCDAGFAALVGYTREDAVGRMLATFRSPRTPATTVAAWGRSLLASGVWVGEVTFRHSSGVDVVAHCAVSAAATREGRITHHVASLHGLGRDREVERLRAIDQSVALVSRLMESFANRLNNIAGEIVAVGDQAMLSDDPASAGDALARVQSLATDLGDVGRRMLALSAEGAEAGPADLGQVARDLADLLRVAGGGRTRVEVRAQPTGPWVAVAPQALVRASIHLGLRALQGGTEDAPVVVSGSVEGEDGVLRIRYVPTPAERAALGWLLPGGTSASPEVNALITSAYGQGVELNLEEEADGHVAIAVRARVAPDAPERDVPAPAEGDLRWGTCILVEDNESLREIMALALEGLFTDIRQVADGDEAALLIEAAGGVVDLVVVDLQLPTGSGLDMLAVIQERWPGIKTVVASGAAGEGATRSARAAGARAVLRKPFRLNEFRAVVRSVMAGAEW